jgi:hypothetical protein
MVGYHGRKVNMVGFEVFIAVTMSTIFWDVTTCNDVEILPGHTALHPEDSTLT